MTKLLQCAAEMPRALLRQTDVCKAYHRQIRSVAFSLTPSPLSPSSADVLSRVSSHFLTPPAFLSVLRLLSTAVQRATEMTKHLNCYYSIMPEFFRAKFRVLVEQSLRCFDLRLLQVYETGISTPNFLLEFCNIAHRPVMLRDVTFPIYYCCQICCKQLKLTLLSSIRLIWKRIGLLVCVDCHWIGHEVCIL